MDLLSQNEFEELANYSNDTCISIFIPTHRAGEETLSGKDAKELKSQLREVVIKLKDMGWHQQKIDKFLKPASELLEDSTYWRYNSDGLAIFLSEKFSKIVRLPIFFESYHYISKEFYIRPLLPLFMKDGSYYILSIGLKNINFYECTRHTITEIDVAELTPSRLEDTVGYDWEQKMVQFRSQQQGDVRGRRGSGQATFHGHSGDKADQKAEILRFLHEVDSGIMNVISDEHDPLLIACIDYMFPIYKEANTYPHLWDEHIAGNPADKDAVDLHREGWDILEPHFEKDRQDKIDLFHQFKSTDKGSVQLEDIVPAANHGKIDTLFIQNREDVFGTFDKENNTVNRGDGHTYGENYSLLNFAAAQTIVHGGNVYLLGEEEMPENNTVACAYFRY